MDLVISLDKPKKITSQEAVTAVKRILRIRKAGHAGTLDPLATGLLMICTGRATRLATYFSDFDKEYTVVMKLGEATDTQDATGKITERFDINGIDEPLVRDALLSYEGRISQTPPMFSALKHKGRPLYRYAREGVEIPRKEREVTINRVELISFESPLVRFRVSCSKGTYIRTLCDDVGKKIGSGAHLHELRRESVGVFSLADSIGLGELRSVDIREGDVKGIYSMDSALSWMPELKVTEKMARAVTHGNPIMVRRGMILSQSLRTAAGIRIKSPDGVLLAIGRFSAGRSMIMMDIVFGEGA
jgi:tRNA pseudouridine55 synthase